MLNIKQTSVFQEGFDGCLYSVPNEHEKIMIVFTGSDGGLKTASKIAECYQKDGMSALALGYFKTAHTGKNLSKIPLEYIEKAIIWLKKSGYKKIGIDALSKGTEYAIYASIEFPEISCLILRSPSYFISEGLCGRQPSGTSCWSFRGKEFPYTKYNVRKFNTLRTFSEAKEFSLLSINTGKYINPASVIPIEKIHAPVLLFSTKSDTIWPSAESGENLTARLKENNFSYEYRHVCFEYISHLLVPLIHKSALLYLKLCFKSERHYPKQCQAERDEMINEINKWTTQVWK